MIEGRLILREPDRTRVVSIGPAILRIGRDPGNDLVVSHRDLSRLHCQLEPLPEGGHKIVDLGSTNGVRVNGRRVQEAVLSPFDSIRLGQPTLIYLDAETRADKVCALLAPPDFTQTEARCRGPGRGADGLLRLLLRIQELGVTRQVRPQVDQILAALCAASGSEAAWLSAECGAGSRLEVSQGLGQGFDPSALARESWIRVAMEEGRVAQGPSALGPVTVYVPVRSPAWDGKERRHGWVGRVGGGLFLAGDRLRSTTPEQLKFLRAIGRQLGIVLSSAELRREATVEPLTQLLTRRAQERVLEEELQLALFEHTSLAVSILDVDDFKGVNDRYGHAVGDDVLRGLGRILTRSLRRKDSAGRWGGEELLVVLPHTDASGALATVQKLVAAVAQGRLVDRQRVTVSAGVAVFPRDATNVAELVRCADRALYAAKACGKNRCEPYRRELEAGEPGLDGGRTSVVAAVRLDESARLSLAGLEDPRGWLHSETYSPIPLQAGTYLLGRSAVCDIVIPDAMVSRQHARVSVGETIGVEDLGSRNGTRVNGERIDRPTPLRLGDEVEVGPFSFQLREEGVSENETAHLTVR